jgi:hypothetical protein
MRKRASNGTKWCTKKTDGACTSSRKNIILSEKPLQSQIEYFARKYIADYVT